MRDWIASALIVGMLIAFSGCGDDESKATTAGTGSTPANTAADANGNGSDDDDAAPSSKAAFVKKANAICAAAAAKITGEASAQFRAAFAKPGYKKKRTELELIRTVAVPGLHAELDEIRGLSVPDGDEDRIEAMLEATEEALDAMEADPRSASGGREPFADAERLADAYGLTACPYG